MDLALHFSRLATKHGVTIGSHSSGGRASRRKRHVDVRPVKSAVTYAIALHELGHVLGPMQSGTRLEAEAGAWLWARENALVWNDACEATMRRNLFTYFRWAKRKHARGVRNAPKLPALNHAFWNLSGLSIVSEIPA